MSAVTKAVNRPPGSPAGGVRGTGVGRAVAVLSAPTVGEAPFCPGEDSESQEASSHKLAATAARSVATVSRDVLSKYVTGPERRHPGLATANWG